MSQHVQENERLGRIVDPINIYPIHPTNMNVFCDPLELLVS